MKYIFIILFFLSISSNAQQKSILKNFPESTPEQQGLSSAVLDSLFLFIKNKNQNIHHITILRNAKTVLDTDIYPYSSKYPHDLASVTKSITSLLIGIAIDKDFIKNENESISVFFPEALTLNPELKNVTIKDLLTMRSGFDCSSDNGEKALNEMRETNDWLKYVFNLPLINKPGEKFSYCSCNSYLLGEIIYRTTQLAPHDFAKKYLFQPLAIKGTRWLSNYKGINHGWGDLFMNPDDMAKIGMLVLYKGKLNNLQIVSKQWMEKITNHL